MLDLTVLEALGAAIRNPQVRKMLDCVSGFRLGVAMNYNRNYYRTL